MATSIAKRNDRSRISKRIIQDLTNIPMPIENQTNPSRYSFFMGLKNVLRSNGSENCCRNALFKE
jgi:hypothetical protein